jgi:glycosyltransferase involved in cell wall biosynthesis
VAQFEPLARPYELILVNDGSSDDTGPRADALVERWPALRVLHHAERKGQGAALRTGIAAARHPLLLTAPCDRQYRAEEFKLLLDRIDRVDLVTGCRTGRRRPFWRRVVGGVYRLLVRVLIGLSLQPSPCSPGWVSFARRWAARWLFAVRTHDAACALRLYRRSVFRRLPIQSDGEFAQVEILAKANFLGCLMEEVPVAYAPPAAAPDRAERRRYWRELARLLRNPDFGPAELPPEGEEPKQEGGEQDRVLSTES